MVDYFPVGPQTIGIDTIALSEFGGEIGDRPGAVLRVDGWPRVNVLRPRSVATGGPDFNVRFQDAVRELALTYDFSGRNDHGPVDIVWKAGQEGIARQYGVPGEAVDRVV